jgi:DNA-directed RNA polymerase subunit RPC12/RpoP
MPEYIPFNFTEIEKVGFVCSNCGSEVVVNLAKANSERLPHACPACYVKDAGGAIMATGLPPFIHAKSWISEIIDWKGKAKGVRLYFKKED